MRRLAVVVAALLLAGSMAGCAAGGDRVADPRAADVAFAHAMIPHHEQALELAALVPGRAASPAVADLAFRIDRHQAKEIGQLQGVLRAWGESPSDHGAHAGHGGMLLPGEIDRLRALSGPEFDRAWAAAMITHHEGAVAMARGLLDTTGERSTLTELARTTIAVQQAEIGALRAVLT